MKENEVDFQKIPSTSGVYLFYEKDKVIYVGKSVNLRARIRSHFKNAKIDNKEKMIVEKTTKIETKVTESDFLATLLEAELIKKHQPKYNLRWKDDKNFLYIKITIKDEYPKLFPVRKENDGKSLYFGPFSSTQSVNFLLRELRRIIPFCTQKKTQNHPCFYAKLGLCQPCPGYIKMLEEKKEKNQKEIDALKKEYKKNIKNIIEILQGKFERIIHSLKKRMKKLSQKEKFEEALKIRQKIEQLEELIYKISFTERESSTFWKEKDLQKELKEFLTKYYPSFSKTKIIKIEAYDISNFFGQQAVGSMIVFTNGFPNKSEYRRFKIKNQPSHADTLMLKEILKRRFAKKEWELPQIIVIDGGRPQWQAASLVLKEKKLKIPIIGLAKSPDRLVVGEEKPKTIKLPGNSFLFNFFRYLRDESHRFAKKYHLYLRKKKMML